MIKKFKDLYELDVKKYIKKRPIMKKAGDKWVVDESKEGLDYIEWSVVLRLLYENGAEKVRYGTTYNQEGHPLFTLEGGAAPYLRIWVEIDGDKVEMPYPLINGQSKGYSDNQFHINTAIQRGFVKVVAINWGLGLSLWEKEEQLINEDPIDTMNIELNENLNNYITKLFNNAIKKLGDANDVHSELGTTKKSLSDLYKGDNSIKKQDIVDKLIDIIG